LPGSYLSSITGQIFSLDRGNIGCPLLPLSLKEMLDDSIPVMTWAGTIEDEPPEPMDCAIHTIPVGKPVIKGLKNLAPRRPIDYQCGPEGGDR
jgi:hypothetical protein